MSDRYIFQNNVIVFVRARVASFVGDRSFVWPVLLLIAPKSMFVNFPSEVLKRVFPFIRGFGPKNVSFTPIFPKRVNTFVRVRLISFVGDRPFAGPMVL